jgi:hypothetical protein
MMLLQMMSAPSPPKKKKFFTSRISPTRRLHSVHAIRCELRRTPSTHPHLLVAPSRYIRIPRHPCIWPDRASHMCLFFLYRRRWFALGLSEIGKSQSHTILRFPTSLCRASCPPRSLAYIPCSLTRHHILLPVWPRHHIGGQVSIPLSAHTGVLGCDSIRA